MACSCQMLGAVQLERMHPGWLLAGAAGAGLAVWWLWPRTDRYTIIALSAPVGGGGYATIVDRISAKDAAAIESGLRTLDERYAKIPLALIVIDSELNGAVLRVVMRAPGSARTDLSASYFGEAEKTLRELAA